MSSRTEGGTGKLSPMHPFRHMTASLGILQVPAAKVIVYKQPHA